MFSAPWARFTVPFALELPHLIHQTGVYLLSEFVSENRVKEFDAKITLSDVLDAGLSKKTGQRREAQIGLGGMPGWRKHKGYFHGPSND